MKITPRDKNTMGVPQIIQLAERLDQIGQDQKDPALIKIATDIKKEAASLEPERDPALST